MRHEVAAIPRFTVIGCHFLVTCSEMTACGTQLGHRVGVAEPDALVTEKLGTILSVYFSYARSGADPMWLAGLTGSVPTFAY